MPELPEVEIVVRGLRKTLEKKKIKKVKLFREKLRRDINFSFIKDLEGATIKSVERRAKYILINLSNEKTLMVHLGMTGQITFDKDIDEKNLKKHSHILIELNDKHYIVYNDVRRFGLALTMDSKDLEEHELIKNLGIEPLQDSFNGEFLLGLFKNRKTNIKTAILNQNLIAGIGNIYACEALHYSHISPIREARSLSLDECAALAKQIKRVLNKSIKHGGSTLKDYVQSDGSIGSFQNEFAVYGREGEACKSCKSIVKRIQQGGRSTFYCEECQK